MPTSKRKWTLVYSNENKFLIFFSKLLWNPLEFFFCRLENLSIKWSIANPDNFGYHD